MDVHNPDPASRRLPCFLLGMHAALLLMLRCLLSHYKMGLASGSYCSECVG